MKFLERLDRIVRPIAVPNLTMILIVGQVFLLVATAGNQAQLQRAELRWSLVMAGEVWRLLTFLFVPVAINPLFLLFALYLFYLFGTALERLWGTVRYCTFLYLGVFLTIASALLVPEQAVSGAFLLGTVFLAFATYNPTFELRLFFILPIQIKWLAFLQAAGYIAVILFGSMSDRITALASIGNYLIFFGPRVFEQISNKRRRMDWQARQINRDTEPRHRCTTCGIDSNTDPRMDFRYCSKCDGQQAYCEDHLRNHTHVVHSDDSQDR